jgi:hypothetical protein
MDKIKYFIFLFTTLLVLSCGDSINVEEEVDANYLVSSQVFQQYVSDHEALMAPLTKHLQELEYNEVEELEDKLFKEFELIEESTNKAFESDIHLSNIVKAIGYESVDQYSELFEEMRSSLLLVLEKYPELNNFHEFEPHGEMGIAMGQLINEKPNSNELIEIDKKTFFQIGSIDLEIENSTCEDNEGLSECLAEARSDFHWLSAGCFVVGTTTVIGANIVGAGISIVPATSAGLLSASGCQAVNVLRYLDNQQSCITGNC